MYYMIQTICIIQRDVIYKNINIKAVCIDFTGISGSQIKIHKYHCVSLFVINVLLLSMY